jgi:ABC-type transport system substrate-binding protein
MEVEVSTLNRTLIMVVSLAVLVGLPAMSRPSSAAGAPLNKYPKNGTIIISDWQFPDTGNPFQTGLGVTSYGVLNSTFASLIGIDNHGQLFADLLKNVPSIKNGGIKNGGKTIILELKPGQYWSSGSEITNKDIKFSWQMYSDPVTGPACFESCDAIASIQLVGKYTAILHLKSFYAPILSLGLFTLYPHNWAGLGTTPHAAATKLSQDTKFNYEDSSYWTSGPFQVSQWVNNDRVVLTPMKYYHAHPGPFLKRIIFAAYADKPGLIAAAGKGDTDVTTDYTYADLPALRLNQSRYKIYVTPSFIAEHLEFNVLDATYNGKPNPVHDVRVRQALALGVDKIGLIEGALSLTAKQAKAIVSYTPWTVTSQLVQLYGDKSLNGTWDPIQKKYVQYGAKALADAKTLLKEAGYADGFHLDFLTTSGNPTRAAEYGVLANNWQKLGVTMTLIADPPPLFAGDWDHNGPRNHGAFQVNMWTFGSAVDPDGLKTLLQSKFIDRAQSTHSAVNTNFSGIQDKIIDQGMKKGAATFDPKLRAKYYKQVQERLNQQAYWVMLWYRANIGTIDKHVVGMTGYPSTGFFGNTWNPWAWKYKK